jgi:hypothetical protein
MNTIIGSDRHWGSDHVLTEIKYVLCMYCMCICTLYIHECTYIGSDHVVTELKYVLSGNICDYRRDFRLVNEFIDHLYTRLVTTSNYSATANHNSQITPAPAKPFSACCVFTSSSLATASNSGDSSASCAQVSRTDWFARIVFTIAPRRGRRRNTPFLKVPLLLRVDSLLWKCVYWAVAYKRVWYIRLSDGCRIVTAVHAKILCTYVLYTYMSVL